MKADDETSDTGADSPPHREAALPQAGRLPAAVRRLGWVSFLTDVSSEMIFPLLPQFLASLPGTPARALGLIEGVADATASLFRLGSGWLSDRRKNKKPLVVLGYSLSAAVRPLISLASSWPFILLCRFGDRIGKGIRSAPRDALIAAVTPAERRGEAFGLHRGFDNAGAILGPLVGAALLSWFGLSLRTVFALAAIPGILAVATLFWGVQERPATAEPPKDDFPKQEPHGGLPIAFRRYASVVVIFTLAASSDAFLLLRAGEVGIAAPWIPVLWAVSNAIRAALSRHGGRLSDRFGRKRVLAGSWGLYALCYTAFAYATTPPALIVTLGIYSLYAAYSEGTERAFVADLVPQEARGRAFGWFHGGVGFAALPASALFGWLWARNGPGFAFLCGAAIAAFATLGLLLLVPSPQAKPARA